MTIRSSIAFTFDGISSDDMGLYNVNVSSGMLEEPFLATRQINEVKIRGRDKPYFSGVTHAPLTFTLTFAFLDEFDSDKLRQVSRWLSAEYYKPLTFSDTPDRIYYAMLDSDSKLTHNGASNGYITVTMRCDSPYSYSPVYVSPTYDLSTNTSNGTTIQFDNSGDISIFPEIYITKVGAGDVSIVNNSNGGQTFQFTGLSDGETVYVDNENEIIQSDLVPTTYRYSNFNNNFLELVYGANNLQVYGTCKIYFRYQFILLQG